MKECDSRNYTSEDSKKTLKQTVTIFVGNGWTKSLSFNNNSECKWFKLSKEDTDLMNGFKNKMH